MSFIIAIKSLGRWKLLDRTLYPTRNELDRKMGDLAFQHGEFKAFDADHEPGSTILKKGFVAVTESITDVRSVVANIVQDSFKDRLSQIVKENFSYENADDDAAMKVRYHYAAKQPKPFPFDPAPGSIAIVHTENFRRFKPQDWNVAYYLYAAGWFEGGADLSELAIMMDKGRRWERIQEKRQATGDQSPLKPWVAEWEEVMGHLVEIYREIGIDFFTGEMTGMGRTGTPQRFN